MLLEDLVDLLHVQALALGQQEVDEEGADGAAASEEEEHSAGRDRGVRRVHGRSAAGVYPISQSALPSILAACHALKDRRSPSVVLQCAGQE